MSVVVSYLPTPEGEVALAHAVREVLANGGPLIVVPSRAGKDSDDVHAAMKNAGAQDVESEVLDPVGPDVTDFLLETVRTRSARLLVIGLRRRSAVGKLILGSHAQRILLDADCPVLAVKP